MDLHLSHACRRYATQSSTSFFDRQLSDAHIANDESVKSSGANKSAKVVLASYIPRGRAMLLIAVSYFVVGTRSRIDWSESKQRSLVDVPHSGEAGRVVARDVVGARED